MKFLPKIITRCITVFILLISGLFITQAAQACTISGETNPIVGNPYTYTVNPDSATSFDMSVSYFNPSSTVVQYGVTSQITYYPGNFPGEYPTQGEGVHATGRDTFDNCSLGVSPQLPPPGPFDLGGNADSVSSCTATSTNVNLNWTYSSGATRYDVYGWYSGSSPAYLFSVGGTSTTIGEVNLNSTTFWYIVAYGNSQFTQSNTIQINTPSAPACPSPTPPPTPPVTCSGNPDPAFLNPTVTVTWTASGGNGSYSWSGDASGTGSSVSPTYSTPGQKNVTVTSGAQTGTCSVNVVPPVPTVTPTPSPTPPSAPTPNPTSTPIPSPTPPSGPTPTLAVGSCSVNISASPSTITNGSSSTLSWSSAGDADGFLQASGSWAGDVGANGSSVVTPPSGTYTYTLTCIGTDNIPHTSSAVVTVTPSASPTPASSPTPSPIPPYIQTSGGDVHSNTRINTGGK